jgi:hypothetical protein
VPRAKETVVFSPGDFQIVVTYHDWNGLWKDYGVDPQEVTERAPSADERELACFMPHFWTRVSRISQIKHVGVTLNGRTVQLLWPPPQLEPVARPALATRIWLRRAPDERSTKVSW